MNTHLDDQSDEARQYGASMVHARGWYEEVEQGAIVLLSGDFNSEPWGDDSAAYLIATGVNAPMALKPDFATKYAVPPTAPPFNWVDLRTQTPPASSLGQIATYTGFNVPNSTAPYTHIDFIFRGSAPWTVTRHIVEESLLDDGTFASDHRVVVSHITM